VATEFSEDGSPNNASPYDNGVIHGFDRFLTMKNRKAESSVALCAAQPQIYQLCMQSFSSGFGERQMK
jgi:hypothetical protein